MEHTCPHCRTKVDLPSTACGGFWDCLKCGETFSVAGHCGSVSMPRRKAQYSLLALFGVITVACVGLGSVFFVVRHPEAASGVALLALLCFGPVAYFLPTMKACYVKHHNSGAIFIINFFLGWTFLGWVVALAMAYTQPSNRNR